MSSEEQGQPPPESVVVGNKRKAEDDVDVVSPSAEIAKLNVHIEKGTVVLEKWIGELKDRIHLGKDMDMDLELKKMVKDIFSYCKSCVIDSFDEEALKHKKEMDELRKEHSSFITMAHQIVNNMQKIIENERMLRRRLTDEVERLKNHSGDSPPPPPPTCVVHYNSLIQGFCSNINNP
jgi:hypothetical protein